MSDDIDDEARENMLRAGRLIETRLDALLTGEPTLREVIRLQALEVTEAVDAAAVLSAVTSLAAAAFQMLGTVMKTDPHLVFETLRQQMAPPEA